MEPAKHEAENIHTTISHVDSSLNMLAVWMVVLFFLTGFDAHTIDGHNIESLRKRLA